MPADLPDGALLLRGVKVFAGRVTLLVGEDTLLVGELVLLFPPNLVPLCVLPPRVTVERVLLSRSVTRLPKLRPELLPGLCVFPLPKRLCPLFPPDGLLPLSCFLSSLLSADGLPVAVPLLLPPNLPLPLPNLPSRLPLCPSLPLLKFPWSFL